MLYPEPGYRKSPVSDGYWVVSVTRESVGARLRAVREATGKKQQDFVPLLDAAAADLYGSGELTYSQSALSRLETGGQTATLEDIAVFARVDPKRRGKLWVAWGETEDAELRPVPKVSTKRFKDAPGTADAERRRNA